MSGPVFLVLTSDDKQGTLYPDVVGPFATNDDAVAFAEKYHLNDPDEWEGGYRAALVIGEATAGSPEDWVAGYEAANDVEGDDDDESDTPSE